jgi:hypothetical protein
MEEPSKRDKNVFMYEDSEGKKYELERREDCVILLSSDKVPFQIRKEMAEKSMYLIKTILEGK